MKATDDYSRVIAKTTATGAGGRHQTSVARKPDTRRKTTLFADSGVARRRRSECLSARPIKRTLNETLLLTRPNLRIARRVAVSQPSIAKSRRIIGDNLMV